MHFDLLFFTTGCLLLLHYTFVRPKLKYDPTVSNSIKTADAKKVEWFQWKFVALIFTHIFPYYRGVDPGLVGREACIILGALFKKNTKLRI